MGLESFIQGSTVTIETSLFPMITIDVAEAATGEQGLVTKVLRPRITVRAPGSSRPLFQAQPAGDPDAGVPWGKLLVLGGVVTVLLWKL